MKRTLFGFVVGAFLIVSLGTIWDAAWESRPAGTELASDIDLFIQELKDEIGDRDSVEHIFGVGSDDNGLARMGSSRAFQQDAAPTDIDGPGAYNSTAGSFTSTLLTTDEIGATTRDLGAGRVWIDSNGPDGVANTPDDRSLAAWDETDNRWEYVDAVDPTVAAASQRFFDSRTNLIYNGSFEVTDGTGAAASTTVPAGWVNTGAATIAYAVPETTEGAGLAVAVTDSGTGGDNINQVLNDLKASTTYYVVARVDGAATVQCRLSTSGAATDITAGATLATSAATTMTTVSGTFVTAAALDDVTIILESENAADVCTWDHVGVYELSSNLRAIPSPGIQAIYTQDSVNDATIDTTFGNNPFVSTSIVIPGPGYIVMVDAMVSTRIVDNTNHLLMRLARDDCAGGAFSAVTPVTVHHNGPGAAVDGNITTPLTFVDTAPVSGGTCIYRVEVRESGAAAVEVNPITALQTGSSLRLLLMPTR